MKFEIICPYCFDRYDDDKVLFRSKYISDSNGFPLPIQYRNYQDPLKEYETVEGRDAADKVRDEYIKWDFFKGTNDKKYEKYWREHGGLHNSGVENHSRHAAEKEQLESNSKARILNPSNPEHQKFLRKQSGGAYYAVDIDGMVSSVQLLTGEICDQRVCPNCHKPLPSTYGKAQQKFVSVIGTRGTGKTVFLRQLIENIELYLSRVGLSIFPVGNIEQFKKSNVVSEGAPLPVSTLPDVFQPPLIFDIQSSAGNRAKRVETLVLCDVAGEVFSDEENEGDRINLYYKCVLHSDGMIFIVEPEQFREKGDRRQKPGKTLEAIHRNVKHGAEDKYENPIAVCISKCDDDEFKEVFGDELYDKLNNADKTSLRQSVSPRSGLDCTGELFKEWFEIHSELELKIKERYEPLNSALKNNYSDYSFFALSSLGCGVEFVSQDASPFNEDVKQASYSKRGRAASDVERGQYDDIDRDAGGGESREQKDAVKGKSRTGHTRGHGQESKPIAYPKGPVHPKHIEDPLLWMLYRFQYYKASIPMYSTINNVICSECHKGYTFHLGKDEKRKVKVRKPGLIGSRIVCVERTFNYQCVMCGRKFYGRDMSS